MRAVGSTSMGHARHTRDCVATESPWDEIARSVVTRHSEECKGSKAEGFVYFPFFLFLFIHFQCPHKVITLLVPPPRHFCHWLSIFPYSLP